MALGTLRAKRFLEHAHGYPSVIEKRFWHSSPDLSLTRGEAFAFLLRG